MKVASYQKYFNLLRKNSYKGYKSPLSLLQEWMPNFDSIRYLNFPILDLDYIFNLYFSKVKGDTMCVNIPQEDLE